MTIKAPGAMCDTCPLQNHPFVPPSGSSDAPVFIIGEGPGEQEAKEGKPFVGPSGKLLDAALRNAGIEPENTFRTNVVMCRTSLDNREPTETEMLCCRTRLIMEIKASKAERIVVLGKVAKEALLVSNSERGVWVPFGDKFVMPTWHPAYVLRKPSEATALLRDIEKVAAPHIQVGWTMPEAIKVETPAQLEEQLAKCPERAPVAFDGEMDNIHWHAGSWGNADAVLALALCWDPKWGVVMDDEMLYDQPATIPILQRFFDNTDHTFAAHNGKFDNIFFKTAFGLNTRTDFDTMLAHYVLDENTKHGLKELATDYLGAPDYEKMLIKQYLKSKNDFYSNIPTPQLMKYGVCDVSNTLIFYDMFGDELRRNGQYGWPFMNIIMPASQAFVGIEMRGMKVDVPHLNRWHDILDRKMIALQAQGRDMVGRPGLNMNSTQQLAVVIYDEIGLPPPPNKRLNPRSTAHDAVEHLIGKHPFINLLMEYRRVAKMQSSYVDNMLEAMDPKTHRVHMTALIHGTEIGRLSMRDPALQTIPRASDRDPYGAAIRSSFIAGEDRKLGITDYSQAELRVMACLSNEPFLIKVYQDDRDLHTEVAIAMYGPNFTHEQRVMCKMFNFAYAYGGNEHSFADDAGLDLATAIRFVREYDKNMPVVKQWKIDQFKSMRSQGYVQSPFGRRRHFPLITQLNADEARKSAAHAPIAGTASDLTLMSVIEAEKRHMNVGLTVHDSILTENDASIAEDVTHELAGIMQSYGDQYFPQIPWKADEEVSDRWVPEPSEEDINET